MEIVGAIIFGVVLVAGQRMLLKVWREVEADDMRLREAVARVEEGLARLEHETMPIIFSQAETIAEDMLEFKELRRKLDADHRT